jgi:hypothetical protein
MFGGRYEALQRHLDGLHLESWTGRLTEIERILGFSLPASARKYQAWWANDPHHSHASAWLDIGWRTEGLDFGSQRITFRRSMAVPRSGRIVSTDPKPATEPVTHAWDDVQSVELRVGFGWQPLGRVGYGERLMFPSASQVPAVYRFRIRSGTGEAIYIGETENLARRFGFYRNPGPSQQTNIRMNAVFRERLSSGGEIAIATMSDPWIERNGLREVADFSSKVVRCLFENAAILTGGGATVESLNRSMS